MILAMVYMLVNRYLEQNASVIDWRFTNDESAIVPWQPSALPKEQWPPDYKGVYAWRLKTLHELQSNPMLLESAKAYYREHNAEFIMHWMDTYDPRREGSKWVPFVFFQRQAEFIHFLNDCARDSENGLTEKCRDAGATWLCCGWSVHSWLFNSDDAIGWGSRKQELVDKLGDVSSIFEKMRMIVKRLPKIWRPKGLRDRDHLTFMKMINPENGSVIAGETGDNIGRGGRTRVTFKDESAHYEHPEAVEAALGDNTNVQIDISSVNGLGNVFHRKREAGIDWAPNAVNLMPGFVRVFVMAWEDHPEKTPQWYKQRKERAEREGMQHVFAQEVDRNYSAAISNTVIAYEWIQAAVDAHKVIRWKDANNNTIVGIPDDVLGNNWIAGLDVADSGVDRNALSVRQSIVWRDVQEWGERDPGVTTRRAIKVLGDLKWLLGKSRVPIPTMYDSIGIGSAVKSEYNRLIETNELDPKFFPFAGWNAGAAVRDPEYRIIPDDFQSAKNKDFFQNMKAQAWWSLRTRFYKTWNNVVNGVIYPIEELIALDSTMLLLRQLMKELAQPTSGPGASLKMLIEKKPEGTKSPNLADAGVMMFFPVLIEGGASSGAYGV